jgi:hypothetical protein
MITIDKYIMTRSKRSIYYTCTHKYIIHVAWKTSFYYWHLCCRLGRTSEFLIYGQWQQRNAIIEATRLLENETNKHKNGELLIGEASDSLRTPKQFKDKAKKWQNFVTQVCDSFWRETHSKLPFKIINWRLIYKIYISLYQLLCNFMIMLKIKLLCLKRSFFYRSDGLY